MNINHIRRKTFVRTRDRVVIKNADPDRGLTREQVELRTACGWANVTQEGAGKSETDIIREHTLTFFNLIFVVLAVVLLIGQSSVKNMTFLIVAVINTVIGIVQEIRAKRAVDKLTLVAAQTVKTVRDGQVVLLRSEDLVRDDICEFASGDQICADAIVRTGQLQVNESLITGEADAVQKLAGDELKSGSFVIAGRARAQLTHVGDDAFAARLTAQAKANPKAKKSEMMNVLDQLIRVIGFLLIPVGIMLFCQSFFALHLGLRESTEGTVAALVGMIPEGLYLLTSIAMAVSAIKLTGKRVLVQDMNCIETLARVDVLCVDKTGTITEPQMQVENIIPLSNDSPERLEQILTALYGSTPPENDTGKALAELFNTVSTWQCQYRIPFTSATKWSAGVFKGEGAFLTGAPEFIMQDRYEEIRESVEPWTSRGYRVLLVAQYHGDPEPGALEDYRVVPLALVLLSSKLRPDADRIFGYFREQGVAVKVISGDNPATVSEVAQRAGIENSDKYIDAGELDTEADFDTAVQKYTVFGRVTPDQKCELIAALKRQKHTVAMIGDGVNDVLAMKSADCGIAMASGAQAASQIAHMVLLDSNFSSVPDIVGEGRRVINNIQRAASLFLVKNIFSLGLALLSLISGWAYPMMPIHLTVVAALTIGVPSFFLAMEPNYERVTGRFLTHVLRRALPGGLTNIIVVMLAQGLGHTVNLPAPQIASVCATVLALVGLLVLFQTCHPFGTFRKVIWGCMAVALALSFTVLGGFFELNLLDWATALIIAVTMLVIPTVYIAISSLLNLIDRLHNKYRAK